MHFLDHLRGFGVLLFRDLLLFAYTSLEFGRAFCVVVTVLSDGLLHRLLHAHLGRKLPISQLHFVHTENAGLAVKLVTLILDGLAEIGLLGPGRRR